MPKKFKRNSKKKEPKKKKYQNLFSKESVKDMLNIKQPEPGRAIRSLSKGSKFMLAMWKTVNDNFIVGIKYNPIRRSKSGNIKVRSKPLDERLRTSDKKEAEDKFLELEKELFS